MRRGSFVLILFYTTAAVAVSIDNIQRDIKHPNSSSTTTYTTASAQLLRTNNRQRNLRSDTSTIEFCGKCIWQDNISCEARAQYLVRNSESSSQQLSLQDARISILETCKSDGSDQANIPLNAFCGTCQYMKMNFNCNSRVDYLVNTYYLGREKAIESLLKDGNCIDSNWVPPNTIEEEEDDDGDTSSDSLSNGAIIGIVIGLTLLLSCCIGLGALYYNKKQKLSNEQAIQQASQQPTSKRAKASEIRKRVLAEANKDLEEANATDSPDSSCSREDQDVKKKKKSLSFSPPVVLNISDNNGDKPDPPTQDVDAEKRVDRDGVTPSPTQQVIEMMEAALDTNNGDEPPDFRDSTISELSCNIDPPTDDEDEVVLPMDEEQQVLPNEETEGIVRRISLEP